MDLQPLMEEAARAAIGVVRNVKADQLALPTPCHDWDVRTLANHLTFWTAFRSEVAARKQTPPPGNENDVDYVTDDWPRVFERQLNKAVAAWAEPGAWEGVTGLAGGQSPAPFIGKMMIGELVVHGWDLARATGQSLTVSPELAEHVYDGVVEFAEQGREYKIFGEPVPVPESASVLDKALALSGRDPSWTP
ncbi:MAG TPA: TIGR03086 family metal-binding protein [Actinophytocola sp.]|uniref:TIGR03086 family metal-binding protein n=1 Tax=Actinophytocola sp. TaxID=1872138 RepID=UPI002DDCEE97|nr:TIGR03086 family metal-binding protein [Actinophytocola sp.]HEV2780887.1 TIGR03086 family metal-binding protein [Actinophytocola sp.]